MDKRRNVLSNLEIAAPCPANWNEMSGDDQIRFCKGCKKNVYNISAMSSDDAEKLILEKEGKLCVRFFRRKDGTIITENCPIGLRWIRDKIKFTALICMYAISWVMSVCKGQTQELGTKNTDSEDSALYLLEQSLQRGPVMGSGSFEKPSPWEPLEARKSEGLVTPWSDNGCAISRTELVQLVVRTKENGANHSENERICDDHDNCFSKGLANRQLSLSNDGKILSPDRTLSRASKDECNSGVEMFVVRNRKWFP